MACFADLEEAEAAYCTPFLAAPLTFRRWAYFVEHAVIESAADLSAADKTALVLHTNGLLPVSKGSCKVCSAMYRYSTHRSAVLGICLGCDCGAEFTILRHSQFATRRLDTYVPALLFWVAGYDVALIARELELSQQYIIEECTREWQEQLSEFVMDSMWEHDQKVGGPGIIVQIDECFINRGKPCSAPFHTSGNRQGKLAHWIWGAVGEDGFDAGDLVLHVLPDDVDHPRGAAVLEDIMRQTIADGSIVVHDDWGAYRAIDWSSLPFVHEPCCVVNHSKEIVNTHGPHTKIIDSVWGVLKLWLRQKFHGTLPKARRVLELSVLEFVWRRRAGLCPIQCWIRQLRESMV